MMDWVQGLDMKLRELHVLSPKENVYTKPPESKPPLLPTRDPNSPLPLPPLRDLPINVLPGVEPVVAAPLPIGKGHLIPKCFFLKSKVSFLKM